MVFCIWALKHAMSATYPEEVFSTLYRHCLLPLLLVCGAPYIRPSAMAHCFSPAAVIGPSSYHWAHNAVIGSDSSPASLIPPAPPRVSSKTGRSKIFRRPFIPGELRLPDAAAATRCFYGPVEELFPPAKVPGSAALSKTPLSPLLLRNNQAIPSSVSPACPQQFRKLHYNASRQPPAVNLTRRLRPNDLCLPTLMETHHGPSQDLCRPSPSSVARGSFLPARNCVSTPRSGIFTGTEAPFSLVNANISSILHLRNFRSATQCQSVKRRLLEWSQQRQDLESEMLATSKFDNTSMELPIGPDDSADCVQGGTESSKAHQLSLLSESPLLQTSKLSLHRSDAAAEGDFGSAFIPVHFPRRPLPKGRYGSKPPPLKGNEAPSTRREHTWT